MAYKRLGDMLLDSGYITTDQLTTALSLQKDSGMRLGETLIDAGYITEKELIDVLCMQLGIDFIDLTNVILPTDLTQTIPKNMAKKYNMVPVRATPDEVFVAMSDPMNFIAQEEARTATRRRIVPMVSTKLAIERAIMQLYGNEGAARAIEDMRTEAANSTATGTDATDVRFAGTTLDAEDEAQSAPTIRLVNSIIERAATERASDVHLEPREGDLQVRMRIDGIMRNVLTVPRDLQSSVISRLKIMGGMNIAERRVPQDGRANVRIKSRDIDLRLSTLPTIYGESVVVRLLDKSSQLLDPKGIGLYGENLDKYHRLIHSNNGVLLIAGPTGSGKSSTMYTMIRELNTEQVKLITLEDPVEYNIDGINQVQINEKTGLTFSSGLRSILRQDPDIVAVGEIRDGETAEIAMRAAITGHLVLSTIHTYDCAVHHRPPAGHRRGAVPHLIRPARHREPAPRAPHLPALPRGVPALPPTTWSLLGLSAASGEKFYHGKGCPLCFHTGYRGRTGVFEILVIDRELRRAIAENAGRDAIRMLLERADFATLVRQCYKARA